MCTGNKSIAFTLQTQGAGKDPISFVEINTPEQVLKIDCSEMHGKVVGDSWFGKINTCAVYTVIFIDMYVYMYIYVYLYIIYEGGLSWSYDEKYVTYVAHPKKPKVQTSYEATAPSKSNKFEYDENWGEKLESISSLVICVIDTQTGIYISMYKCSISKHVYFSCYRTTLSCSQVKLIYLMSYLGTKVIVLALHLSLQL